MGMDVKSGKTWKGGPNGFLPLDLGPRFAFQQVRIAGGPYDNFPGRSEAFGVCVRAERVDRENVDLLLPIEDFSVPEPEQDRSVRFVLHETLRAASQGKSVYVGCMGGWGRTGLFLALLAKAAGVKDPVGYVREHYTPHAVETTDQKRYVENFYVGPLPRHLFVEAWQYRVRSEIARLRKRIGL